MQGASQSKTKKLFLIVDDEPLVRETLSLLLSIDGHSVKQAASGHEALTMFRPDTFDIVFTDFAMPAMTGDLFASAIKRVAPHQPIAMVTAHLEKVRRVPVPWIDVFLAKPFEITELRETIVKLAAPVWALS
jgi:two-component system, cell cycle sensor histidine kinase and response regulator CckA